MPTSIEVAKAEADDESTATIRRLSLHELFLAQTNNTFVQLFRYLVTGVAALGADVATLYLLTRFAGLNYLISAIGAFLVGVMVNYVISSAWVFKRHVVRKRALEFAVFAAIGVIGLGLNELGLWFLSGVLGIYYLQSKLITAGIVFFWNFGARKFALFR